jgi:hypothetical protein
MKTSMLIGLLTLGAGLAGMSEPARAESGIAGRWRGVLLRDGVQTDSPFSDPVTSSGP